MHSGYDTGVISGALVSIGGDLGPSELTNTQKVWYYDSCWELERLRLLFIGAYYIVHNSWRSARRLDRWDAVGCHRSKMGAWYCGHYIYCGCCGSSSLSHRSIHGGRSLCDWGGYIFLLGNFNLHPFS